MSHEAQKQKILDHLRNGGEISSLTGVQMFGCLRVPARISDLKKAGFDIRDRFEYRFNESGKVEKKWKVWWLA